MAITDVRILRQTQVKESKSDKGSIQITGTQELLAISDTANPSFTLIANDTSVWPNLGNAKIPQINDSAAFSGYTLNVTSRAFDYYDEDNEFAVRIVIQYDAKSEEGEEDKPEPIDGDATTWLQMSVQTTSSTMPAKGYWTRGEVPAENAEGTPKPAKNSAGDPVDGLTEDVAMVKLVYTNTQVADPDFSKLLFYVNRCNDGEWLGCKDYSVKVAGFNADYDQKNNVWTVSVEFLYNPATWKLTYFDAGYREIDGTDLVAVLDKSGNPVSKPAPLNGSGGPLLSGEEPVTLDLFPYEIAKLQDLFSNCRI